MKKTLIPIMALLATTTAFSQGFQVNFQGQKQQGMGSAGTALPQDGAAVFFNPGSMSYLKESSINVAMTPLSSNVLFTDASNGSTARTKSPVGTPFSAYGVYKKNEDSKMAYGLGVYTPYGSSIKYEDNWTGRFTLTQLSLKAIYIQPSVSYKLTDNIGIGAGFVYSFGSVNLQKDIPVQDVSGNYGHAELDGKANGFGVNAGIYVKATDQLSFGFTYRSQINMKVKDGTATFTVPSSLASSFPNGGFSASLPLPRVFTFGIGYKPTDKLSLALDINFVGWSAYDTLAFDYENNTSSLTDTKSARDYKDISAFRLGAQYMVTDDFAVRLGVSYGFTPVQDGYSTPETPDANRFGYTAGLGYKFGEHFEADASVYFTHFERDATNIETNLNGTYTANAIAPGLAIIYKF